MRKFSDAYFVDTSKKARKSAEEEFFADGKLKEREPIPESRGADQKEVDKTHSLKMSRLLSVPEPRDAATNKHGPSVLRLRQDKGHADSRRVGDVLAMADRADGLAVRNLGQLAFRIQERRRTDRETGSNSRIIMMRLVQRYYRAERLKYR